MRTENPYVISKRKDSKTYQLTLNPSSGLPGRICQEWQRRSFQNLPDDLAQFRVPKSDPAAKTSALALIAYLKKQVEEGQGQRVKACNSTVGAWIEKFTVMETSSRTGINSAKNKSYSGITLYKYRNYWDLYIKDDPVVKLKMSELEESDILEFINRLSVKNKSDGGTLGGTRTFVGIIVFVRMAFRNYQQEYPKWTNPFIRLEPPKYNEGIRDALTEDEIVKLFMPGILKNPLEFAVCACMFFAGLRRAEIAALKPEDLNWQMGKIKVKRAWQMFDLKKRQLGLPKGKKIREAPFDPLLQEAIKKLWKEYGEYEWVFSKDGKHLHAKWINYRFNDWLEDAGIKRNGRDIVPHCSRHSIATLLESKGVSIRHIQDFLGHSDFKVTKKYLVSTDKTIREIGKVVRDNLIPKNEKSLEFHIARN